MAELFESIYWAVNIEEELLLEMYKEIFFTSSVALLLISLLCCFVYYLLINNGTLQTVLNSIFSWIFFGVLSAVICAFVAYLLMGDIIAVDGINAAAKNFLTLYFCYSLLIYILASIFVKKLSLNANRTPF